MVDHNDNRPSRWSTFMVGEHLLVHPVTGAGVTSVNVYLPRGADWFGFSGERLNGGQSVLASAPADSIPLFQRAGSVIPKRERPRRSTVAQAGVGAGVICCLCTWELITPMQATPSLCTSLCPVLGRPTALCISTMVTGTFFVSCVLLGPFVRFRGLCVVCCGCVGGCLG